MTGPVGPQGDTPFLQFPLVSLAFEWGHPGDRAGPSSTSYLLPPPQSRMQGHLCRHARTQGGPSSLSCQCPHDTPVCILSLASKPFLTDLGLPGGGGTDNTSHRQEQAGHSSLHKSSFPRSLFKTPKTLTGPPGPASELSPSGGKADTTGPLKQGTGRHHLGRGKPGWGSWWRAPGGGP